MRALDGERIRRAIDAAERGTTGRIGVRLAGGKTQDALREAREHFVHAGLHEHEHHNAVIFFIAPRVRRFAVFGDKAIHDRVGDAFWSALIDDMQPYFAKGQMTDGLELGISRVGEQLRLHFPLEVHA